MRRAALLLALVAIAAPAAADPSRSLVMARVPVGDLDLRTEAGATAMLLRLGRAATELCALPQSAVFPGNPGREFRCRQEAVAAAVQRLRTPQLTLAHAAWLSADPAAAPPSLRHR